jgi:tetratricopeptide (TPR) repeat protein
LTYRLLCALIALSAFPATRAAAAAAKCVVAKLIDLPVTMQSLRPTVATKINGQAAQFLIDSGADISMISKAVAVQYHLKLVPAPGNFRINGVGGTSAVERTTVREFTFVGFPLKDFGFWVGGSDIGYAGVLGQDFMSSFDIEYDLADGTNRFFQTVGCENAMLAYWLTPGQPSSVIPINNFSRPGAIATAYLNGQKITVEFDSGAYTSIVSTEAAARAGVTPKSPGVVAAGTATGFGSGGAQAYLATFASFKIGTEEIKNAKLRMADLQLGSVDMLLGADFFISHRIFVANNEHKLYFSYNGGAIFNLPKLAAEGATAAPPHPQGETDMAAQDKPARDESAANPGKAPPSEVPASDALQGLDAAELARRGSAFAARRDFGLAVTYLSKAIEATPNEPEYYLERASAFSSEGHSTQALEDLTRAIALNRDFLPAYLPRANLEIKAKMTQAAIADLDVVNRLAPDPAELRLELAGLYEQTNQFQPAIEQYTLWLKYHPSDSHRMSALSGRCLSGALQDRDLSDALSDCDKVLLQASDKHSPEYAQVYVYRGLIRLQQGRYDRAIADFDTAIKSRPKDARALYARGVAESRNHQKSESERDLAAAVSADADIAQRFAEWGISP